MAVADSLFGLWKRSKTPLLDITPDSYDSNVVINPAVTFYKGQYILLYKCSSMEGKKGFAVAFSDSPEGPFKKHYESIGRPGKDPCIFTYKDRLYLIASGGLKGTDQSRVLRLYTSTDGINLESAGHPLISD